jgi:hypothetical protein
VDPALAIVATGVGFIFQWVVGRIDALKPYPDTSHLGKNPFLSFIQT